MWDNENWDTMFIFVTGSGTHKVFLILRNALADMTFLATLQSSPYNRHHHHHYVSGYDSHTRLIALHFLWLASCRLITTWNQQWQEIVWWWVLLYSKSCTDLGAKEAYLQNLQVPHAKLTECICISCLWLWISLSTLTSVCPVAVVFVTLTGSFCDQSTVMSPYNFRRAKPNVFLSPGSGDSQARPWVHPEAYSKHAQRPVCSHSFRGAPQIY